MSASYKVKLAAVRLVATEVEELVEAVTLDIADANVLDEIVDVLYYIDDLRRQYGITSASVQHYAGLKGVLRSTCGKDKERELRYATEILRSQNAVSADTRGCAS